LHASMQQGALARGNSEAPPPLQRQHFKERISISTACFSVQHLRSR
jgi:hypothetical protein